MSFRRAAAFAALLSLLTALLVALSAPAQATFPGSNGLILFNRGGNLFTATATGGSIKQITTSGGISGAKWSPDGKKIAYRVGTNVLVRTMATSKVVTVAVGSAGAPAWAPNGQTVAFVANLASAPCGEQGVFSVPAVGGSAPRLIWDPQSSNCDPHPDGLRLTLGGYTQDGGSLLVGQCFGYYYMGCSLVQQTLDPFAPAGGTRRSILSIACYQESEFPEDGSASRCNGLLHLSDPRVGPGGNGLLFTGRGGYEKASVSWPSLVGTLPGSTPLPTASTLERIYVIDRSGTGLRRVSTSAGGINPTWSPRGDQVLFTQRSGSTNNIMRVVGTSTTATATVLIANGSQADWQPGV